MLIEKEIQPLQTPIGLENRFNGKKIHVSLNFKF